MKDAFSVLLKMCVLLVTWKKLHLFLNLYMTGAWSDIDCFVKDNKIQTLV